MIRRFCFTRSVRRWIVRASNCLPHDGMDARISAWVLDQLYLDDCTVTFCPFNEETR